MSCAAAPVEQQPVAEQQGTPAPKSATEPVGTPKPSSADSITTELKRIMPAEAEVRAEKVVVELVAHATDHFPFTLHPSGGTIVVSTHNRIAPLSERGPQLQWSSVDISDVTPPGTYGGMHVELVGGSWPTNVVGVLADIRPRVESVRKYVRWTANAWKPWDAAPAAGGVYVAFASWGDRGTLGLQHVDSWSGGNNAFDPRIDVFPKGRAPQIPGGFIPVTLTTSATGHVYAIAAELDNHQARLIIWGPDGGAALETLELPEVAGRTPNAGDVRVVEDRAGAGVVVAGGVGTGAWIPYLVRRDASNWTVWETPSDVLGMVSSVSRRSEGGEMWLTTSGRGTSQWVAGRGDVPAPGKTWRIDRGQQWHKVEFALDRRPENAPSPKFSPRKVALAGSRLWVTMQIDAEVFESGWANKPYHVLASAGL